MSDLGADMLIAGAAGFGLGVGVVLATIIGRLILRRIREVTNGDH